MSGAYRIVLMSHDAYRILLMSHDVYRIVLMSNDSSFALLNAAGICDGGAQLMSADES